MAKVHLDLGDIFNGNSGYIYGVSACKHFYWGGYRKDMQPYRHTKEITDVTCKKCLAAYAKGEKK